LGATRL